MRRLASLACVSLVAVLALAGATRARADSAAAPALQAWATTGPASTFTPQAGHVYVASTVTEEARAFVAVTSAATALVLSADDNALPANAGINACPLSQPIPAGGEIAATDAPAAVCDNPVALAPNTDGTGWRLDLSQLWRDVDRLGAFGVALVPAGPGVWRVGFDATQTRIEAAAAPLPEVAGVDAESLPPMPPSTGEAVFDVGSVPVLTNAPTGTAAPVIATVDQPAVALVRPAVPVDRVRTRSVNRPASLPFLALAIAGVALVGTGARRRPRRDTVVLGIDGARVRRVGVAAVAVAAFALLPVALLSEADVFRLGTVVIVAVAAIGLHMLVNWGGELSLAQAAVIGLPAFTVAKLASVWGVSPLVLLPLGVAVGVAAGVAVGLPSLRARGLQVALVTLAAGIAIERFLFTKPWLVGPPGGVSVPTPALGPLKFTTSAGLFPVLALVAVASVVAAAMLYRSKIGRALALVRDQPEVAAAFAVPVTTYRLAAYGLAGAYAGLAGGLDTAWVQRLTPGAFPFTLSFTYMIMAVLAGRGFVWGVIVAVALLEGGRVFASGIGPVIAYGGPVALILVVTRYRSGFNGTGRQLMERIRAITTRPSVTTIVGIGAIVIGFLSIGLAWYHAGNTDQVWVQNQLLVSGGLVGLAFVILGGLALATERIVRALEKRE